MERLELICCECVGESASDNDSSESLDEDRRTSEQKLRRSRGHHLTLGKCAFQGRSETERDD